MTTEAPKDIYNKYFDRFGEMPALGIWHGELFRLEELMEEAINKGQKHSENDLWRAQGFTPASDPGTSA